MLRYIGNGNWLPGVPARDLTDAEVALYGGKRLLLATGIYSDEPASAPAEPITHAEPKAGKGGGKWQEE